MPKLAKLRRSQSLLAAYVVFVLLHAVLGFANREPIFFGDEEAYLTMAHRFALGLMPAAPETHWFPGYALVLAPIFWLTTSAPVAYVGAQLVNALLLAFLPVNGLRLANVLVGEPERRGRSWVVFVVACYPSFLLRSNLVLADSLIIAAMSFALVEVATAAERGVTRWAWARILALGGVMAAAHGLGIVLAVACMLTMVGLVLRIGDPTQSGQARRLLGVGAGGVLLLAVFGGVLESSGWPRFNVAFLMQQLRAMDVVRVRNFLLVASGSLWNMQASTLGLAGVGLWSLVRLLGRGATAPQRAFAALSLVAFVGVLLVSNAAGAVDDRANVDARADGYIYGRYLEMVLWPFLLAGLAAVAWQPRRVWRWLLVSCFVTIGLAWAIHAAGQLKIERAVFLHTILGIQAFRFAHPTFDFDFASLATAAAVVSMAGVALVRRGTAPFAALLVPFFLVGTFVGVGVLKEEVEIRQRLAARGQSPLTFVLERLTEVHPAPTFWYDEALGFVSWLPIRRLIPAAWTVDFSETGPGDALLGMTNDGDRMPPGSRLIGIGLGQGAKLWLAPGRILDAFVAEGWVAPAGYPAALGVAASVGAIDLSIVAGEAAGTIALRMTIRHAGRGAFWPATVGETRGPFAVMIGISIMTPDGVTIVRKNVDMSRNVYPGIPESIDLQLTGDTLHKMLDARTVVIAAELFQNDVGRFDLPAGETLGLLGLSVSRDAVVAVPVDEATARACRDAVRTSGL